MPLAELQTHDVTARLSPWFTPPDVPLQPAGQHDTLPPPVAVPTNGYTTSERQVEALREWRKRGEYLDHLVSLIHRGHSVSFEEFSDPVRSANEPTPVFSEVAGSAFDQAPAPQPTPPGDAEVADGYEPHRGQLLLGEDTSPAPSVPSTPPTPVETTDDTPTKKFKPVIPPVDKTPGRHALRTPAGPEPERSSPSPAPTPPARPTRPGPSGPPSPTPAQPRPAPPLEPPNRRKDEPHNLALSKVEQPLATRRKLTTRHLGAATMRLVRRLSFVVPRKLQRAHPF